MYIIPAIDLMGGKCVRLIQGEYHRQITYEDDPVKKADEFISAGADWLHIVDLDGARVGKLINTEQIFAVITHDHIRTQVGGGIRNEDSIKQLLDMGAERVIIGTKAISDFEWFSRIAERFKGKIVLSLDSRGSKIATHAWTQDTHRYLVEFAEQAAKLPLAAVIYTDINKDGMMAGPNLERTKTLAEAVDVPIIAAGGVHSVQDVKNLASLGIEAAIIGRALYEGAITVAEAIAAAG